MTIKSMKFVKLNKNIEWVMKLKGRLWRVRKACSKNLCYSCKLCWNCYNQTCGLYFRWFIIFLHDKWEFWCFKNSKFWEINEIIMNYTFVIFVAIWWRVDCWFDEKIVVNWKENILSPKRNCLVNWRN
jgi:hypothetical protein